MGECVLRHSNKCDNLVEKGECTIYDWCALYEPLHQSHSPNFFWNGHCEKD